jgi:molybdopterin converting factor small subunit
MELFRNFYRVRQVEFPSQFANVLTRIETLCDPERTDALEALNDEIFGSLTRHLFDEAKTAGSEDKTQIAASPEELIGQLLDHLAQKNPYFALWLVYERGVGDRTVAEDWGGYLLQELGFENTEEIAFAQAMSELDKILNLFRNRNRGLPSLAFERIWFLHYLRGPERMAQTRAVLGSLTAELVACTSA